MTPPDSSSLKFWEALADWGTILVIVGVAGEALEILLKWFEYKSKSERFETWCKEHKFSLDVFWPGVFWIMVVGGLIMEFRGSHQAQLITQKENARITQELNDSEKTIGSLVKENTQVRGELKMVEAASTRRVMSPGELQGLSSEMKQFTGTKYQLLSENDSEVDHVVEQLTYVLNDAGWVATAPPEHFVHPPLSLTVRFRVNLDQIILNGVTVEAVRYLPGSGHDTEPKSKADIAADALVAALNNRHIETQRRDDWQKERPPEVNGMDRNVVYIRVGFRPGTGWDGIRHAGLQ